MKERCKTCGITIIWSEADGEWFHWSEPPRILFRRHLPVPKAGLDTGVVKTRTMNALTSR